MKTKQDFKTFMSQLSETNATLDFFCDFDKISTNVADIAISLNTLNYLLSKNQFLLVGRCYTSLVIVHWVFKILMLILFYLY